MLGARIDRLLAQARRSKGQEFIFTVALSDGTTQELELFDMLALSSRIDSGEDQRHIVSCVETVPLLRNNLLAALAASVVSG